MSHQLQPLIDQLKEASDSHVVILLDEVGIHWRCYPESACRCIADIIGNASVMTREKFIQTLEENNNDATGTY